MATAAQVDILLRAKADMAAFTAFNAQVAKVSGGLQKAFGLGGKIGMGIVGAENIFAALKNEIRHVIDNIEAIPGIDPIVVQSINDAKAAFAEFRAGIDRGIASAVSFGAQFGKAVGVGAANLVNRFSGLPEGEYVDIPTADQLARASNPNFDAQVSAAQKQAREIAAKRRYDALSRAGQVADNQFKIDRLTNNTQWGNSLDQAQRAIERERLLTDSEQKRKAIAKELAKAQEDATDAMAPMIGASLEGAAAIEALQQRLATIQNNLSVTTSETLEGQEEQIRLYSEMAVVAGRLVKLEDARKRANLEAAQVITGSLETAILQGGKMRDMLRSIWQDLLKAILHQKLIEPLTKGLSSWFPSIGSLFGFANGTQYAPGGLALVGERGPELVNLPRGAEVIPNHALSSATAPVVVNQYFEVGLTREEMGEVAKTIQRRTEAGVLDAQRSRLRGFGR